MLTLLLLAHSTPAKEVSGTTFADTATIGSGEVPLRGTALQRWKVVFRVHTTGWWQDPATAVEADVPKRLELHYFHDIGADDFRKATDLGFQRQCDAAELATLQPRIAQWNALYSDITAGQRYRITYVPGVGTELAKDGTVLGTVTGADFAKRMFGIWIGEKPVETGHRKDLLDGK